MGSLGAMSKGSKDRYGQGDIEEMSKLVPEGIGGTGSLIEVVLVVIFISYLVELEQVWVTGAKKLEGAC